ncbi:hypothetical protein [Streptomyces sp. NPDC000410]|uniref:hypothetical protein n=1 Tax=Streptomyces sp. NPDC000410 TaxID=3154254 RepID=UPI00331CD3F0
MNKRCASLGGLLESSGNDLYRSDELVLADLNKLKTQYEDTEAVGGQAKAK